MYREDVGADEIVFRASTGRNQAMGRTPGEALNALAAQLRDEEADTLIVARSLSPDRFFAAEQRQRLEQPMAGWRAARDGGTPLCDEEQAELEYLVDAEVRAATERAAALQRAADIGHSVCRIPEKDARQ
jgi:hypothetical protein